MRLIIGLSGASGVIYGVRLLQVLRSLEEVETHLVLSPAAKMNLRIETDISPAQVQQLADCVHDPRDMAAAISSGSFQTHGMIVAPCSIKTLSGIVNCYSDNLLLRAADVTLKERRPLALLVRETPLHTAHCRLLLEASTMGAIIVPPVPAFYNRPKTIDELIDHTVGRLLSLFGIDSGLVKPWQGSRIAKD
jgi:4-hydroxy-3-polyprenylbenzoate decarboxylase